VTSNVPIIVVVVPGMVKQDGRGNPWYNQGD